MQGVSRVENCFFWFLGNKLFVDVCISIINFSLGNSQCFRALPLVISHTIRTALFAFGPYFESVNNPALFISGAPAYR